MEQEPQTDAVRAPDVVGAKIDPATCEVLDGHQHEAVDIDQLANSIATLGQLHHALIIEYPSGRRFIAAGRRRWMACTSLGCQLKADIWRCAEENIDVELFARAIRIAENLQRSEPTPMDIAIQLRAIRNERGFKTTRELADSMNMGESTVKSYLSVLHSSDHLQKMAKRHALPLAQVLELVKCEKKLGIPRTEKLIDRVCKGELSQRKLAELRKKPERTKAGKREKQRTGPQKASLATARKSGDALLRAVAENPAKFRTYAEELMNKIAQLYPPNPQAS